MAPKGSKIENKVEYLDITAKEIYGAKGLEISANAKKQIIIRPQNVLLLSFSSAFSAMYIVNRVKNASIVYCFRSLE